MLHRVSLRALFLIGPLALFAGCTNPSGLDSITVSPTAQSIAVGETAQFSATGTFGNSKSASTKNVTGSVTWTSSAPAIATISSTGLATAVSAGSTTITATGNGFAGTVTASAVLTVTGTSGVGGAGSTLVSLAIIPGAQTVAAPTQTAQFLAIGTTSSGSTEDLTGQVSWISSSAQIATISTGGLATAVGQGTATITAVYNNASLGTAVTGQATFTVTGGTTEQYTGTITILPNTQTLSASGQTAQFIALATSGTTGLQQNVTDSPNITWSSSIPSIFTVSPTGLATGVSQGTADVTAILTNTDGSVVTGTATVSVSLTAPPEPILSLEVIPSAITVLNLQDTGNFLAIGTYSSAPYVRDVTNSSSTVWISSAPSIFPVSTNTGGNTGATAGVVTAFGNGSASIIAESSSPDGTIQTATATFNCPEAEANPNGDPPTPATCLPGTQLPSLLATVTVYQEGLNTTNWEVTAPSATGTPNALHCGPGWALNGGTGGSVCTATYPMGVVTPSGTPGVVLTAQGGAFGGWSYNCQPSDVNGNLLAPGTWTAAGPNYCVVVFTGTYIDVNGNPVAVDGLNETVGAIFN